MRLLLIESIKKSLDFYQLGFKERLKSGLSNLDELLAYNTLLHFIKAFHNRGFFGYLQLA